MLKITLSITLFALCSSASATMYKCQQNGTTSFQDQPCNKGQQQSNVAIKSGAAADFNPQEFKLPPTPPNDALYQQLLGRWCEDEALTYGQINAMMGSIDQKARPNYQTMLQQLKQKDPAAYAQAVNSPPKLVVEVLPNYRAREHGERETVAVVMGADGFRIGSEGLTIYRHGQHFYRGSHEFHRIPLMRCAGS